MKIIFYVIILLLSFTFYGQNVGINTTNPQAKLHVAGNFKFVPNTTVTPTRIVGVASSGLVKEFPLSDDFEIVDGELVVSEIIDENIFLVGDVDQSPDAASTSTYNNFNIGIGDTNENNTIIRVTGETNGYTVTGFTDGYDGRVIYFYNAQNNNVTFSNLNNSSNDINQIITTSGGNQGISNEGVAEFIYDAGLEKWILINIRS